MKKTVLLLLLSGFIVTGVLLCTILFTVRKTHAPRINDYVTDNNSYVKDEQKQTEDNQQFNLHREMYYPENHYPEQHLSQNNSVEPERKFKTISGNEQEFPDSKPDFKPHNSAGADVPPPDRYNERTDNLPAHSQPILPEKSLSSIIKSCIPYKETLKAQYMGVDMIYKIGIEGWQNGKCILNFETNATGTGSDFMQEYGIDPSEVTVSAFTPKIRCEFTRSQLLYVGDSVLEESSRGSSKMLKNPNDIIFPEPDKMSLSDLKLLDLLLRQKACKITNWNEFKSIIQEVVDFLSY